jgi:hypothetical protein
MNTMISTLDVHTVHAKQPQATLVLRPRARVPWSRPRHGKRKASLIGRPRRTCGAALAPVADPIFADGERGPGAEPQGPSPQATITDRRQQPAAHPLPLRVGHWEGFSEDEIAERWPEQWQRWRSEPHALVLGIQRLLHRCRRQSLEGRDHEADRAFDEAPVQLIRDREVTPLSWVHH